MSDLVTRCPECGTSFRVTEDQLNVASGAVRCGACLQVFTATDYLVEVAEPPEPEETGEDVQSLTPEVRGMTAEDWAEIEADDDWEDEDDASVDPAVQRQDEAFPEIDVRLGAEDEDAEASQDEVTDELPDELPDEMPVGVSSEERDESPDDMLEDQSEALEAPAPVDWHINVSEESEEFDGEISVSVDPIEIVAEESRLKGRSVFAWGLFSILAVAGLLLQYAWFDMASLSQRTDLRPWFEKTCNALGCDVPDFEDRAALRAGDLIVRSHPAIEDALAIDATVANLASFRQAFPDLVLRFDALDGTPVAARVFSPGDYLAGELSGLKYLPANTEVHISLEIVDPGDEAVNYSLSIH